MAARIDPATGKRYKRLIVNLTNIQVGDVLKSPAGTLRVVRSVHKAPRHTYGGTCLTFIIKHCSWTKSPYTVYTIRELEQIGYTKVGLRSRLDREMDRQIAYEVERKTAVKSQFSCCDVEGIA